MTWHFHGFVVSPQFEKETKETSKILNLSELFILNLQEYIKKINK